MVKEADGKGVALGPAPYDILIRSLLAKGSFEDAMAVKDMWVSLRSVSTRRVVNAPRLHRLLSRLHQVTSGYNAISEIDVRIINWLCENALSPAGYGQWFLLSPYTHTHTRLGVQIHFGFLGRKNINLLPIRNISCVVVLRGPYRGLGLETNGQTKEVLKIWA